MSKFDYNPTMHVYDCSNPYPVPGGQCDCVRGCASGCECLDDNCHEHHHCPPCPPPRPYPFPYPIPPLPAPTRALLYLESSAAIADIADGNPIILPLIRSLGEGLSYNPTTGVITVISDGYYLFDWNINADSESTTNNNVVIGLVQSPGSNIVALSGATASAAGVAVLVSGSTPLFLTAGNTVSLVNETGAQIDIISVTGDANFAASLSVVKIG